MTRPPISPVPKPPKRIKVRKTLRALTPMKRVGKKGAAFPRVKNREFRAWLRTEHPCEIANRTLRLRVCVVDRPLVSGGGYVHHCWFPIDPAHVGPKQSQGAGDVGHCVPLCRAAHRFYDAHRNRWQEATGLSEADMENRAGGYGLKWVERGGAS